MRNITCVKSQMYNNNKAFFITFDFFKKSLFEWMDWDSNFKQKINTKTFPFLTKALESFHGT